MVKFTLTIVTSGFLFMSGTADLFAMESLDEKSGKKRVIAMTEDAEPGPLNHMTKDVTAYLLNETMQYVNPRCLTPVCKSWYSFIREADVNADQMAELHYSATNILHMAMNPFMQKCMHTYWENLFYNGILRYTPIDNCGKVTKGCAAVTLKFSDFKDGTFDLSACGDTGQYIVITTSMDRYFKVGEENKDKTVVGIMPSHRIQQEIKNKPGHPFTPFIREDYSLLMDWDADKAPVVMFWRPGSATDLTWVDYLTTAPTSVISSRNLYDNCGHSIGFEIMDTIHYTKPFHVCF